MLSRILLEGETMNDLENGKVLVIGLDGCEWNVINPLINKGLLPNIKKVLSNGVSGDLKSSIPPITPTAWSSFVTGVNPGKHGIFSYQKKSYKENSYLVTPQNSLDINKECLWHILGRHDKKVCFVNVPMSFPPRPVNGCMITGMMTPSAESEYTFPASLKKELSENGINYRIDLKINKELNQIEDESFQEYYFGDGATRFFDDIYELTRTRHKTIEYLMKNRPWDFFMCVFVGMDRVQHFLWDSLETGLSEKNVISDKIFNYYNYLDEVVGGLIAKAGDETTVIIMSDHGFGRYKGDFLINKFLIDLGLFKVKEKKQKVTSTMKKVARKVGVDKALLTRLFGQKKMESLRMTIQNVDWNSTKAFSLLAHGIHINVKNRESSGCVESGKEYEKLREMLINKLYTIKDPVTNRPVIKKVFKKEEIYSGTEFDAAPDLILLSSDIDHYGIYSTQYKDSIFCNNSWKTGDHRQNGIFIINGPEIKNNYKIDNAEIIDLLPTILYLFGSPIPTYVDGKVLFDAFSKPTKDIIYDNYTEQGQKNVSYDYTKDEAEAVKERLRQLGYID